MKSFGTILYFSSLAGLVMVQPAVAQPLQWQQTEGGSSYTCGGVALEGMEQLRAMRESADVELMFTHGTRGAWMSDVAVNVSDGKAAPLQFTADGPACLLKLPAGEYTIEAEANGVKRAQRIGTQGPVKRVMFNWPE